MKRGNSLRALFSMAAAEPVLCLSEHHSSSPLNTNPCLHTKEIKKERGWWNDQVVVELPALPGWVWMGILSEDM